MNLFKSSPKFRNNHVREWFINIIEACSAVGEWTLSPYGHTGAQKIKLIIFSGEAKLNEILIEFNQPLIKSMSALMRELGSRLVN